MSEVSIEQLFMKQPPRSHCHHQMLVTVDPRYSRISHWNCSFKILALSVLEVYSVTLLASGEMPWESCLAFFNNEKHFFYWGSARRGSVIFKIGITAKTKDVIYIVIMGIIDFLIQLMFPFKKLQSVPLLSVSSVLTVQAISLTNVPLNFL